MDLETMRKLVGDKYAWPGGYPMYMVMDDGEAVCCDCAVKEWENIEDSTKTKKRDGWEAIGMEINYEDTNLYCAHCNKKIESAYGEE